MKHGKSSEFSRACVRARLKSVCERRERATQQYLRRYNKIKYKAQPKKNMKITLSIYVCLFVYVYVHSILAYHTHTHTSHHNTLD